jgi:hypothetical protein
MSNSNEIVPIEPTAIEPVHEDLQSLLPIADIPGLTQQERDQASQLQQAFNILGPAGGQALVCPGNQIGIPESERCPYSSKCVLLRAQKAPQGELCPIEAQQITRTFIDWAAEIDRTSTTLTAAERAFVSEITWIDTQTHRCTSILAKARFAGLTQQNPKEVHPETLEPMTWETAIHSNNELLIQLSTQRRMLLKDWMITPEQKAKKARWEGRNTGDDYSSKQAAKADRLRKLSTKTIEVKDK